MRCWFVPLPSGAEEVLGDRVRLQQPDVQKAVAAPRSALAAVCVVSLAGEENLLSHGEILSVRIKVCPIKLDAIQVGRAGQQCQAFPI
jgi:hypothetical protein